MDRVSVLLGHSSIKVTEKHYSPWVRARQEQLVADVRRTWERPFTEAKGTPASKKDLTQLINFGVSGTITSQPFRLPTHGPVQSA
jgi:hypothetical protein